MFMRKAVVLIILCLTTLLSACGKGKTTEPSSPVEPRGTETTSMPDILQQHEQMNVISSSESTPSAPVEYETADGFMSSFLLASDRELIDTTNDYGVFYRVVYEASLEDNELRACGSMDYRNSKDQDSITISSDLTHVFIVDDNTVYRKGTEVGDQTITKEEFAELLEIRKNSGMFFEVEISNGVLKTAYLAAQ
ncbi:MAG: hypothetical protein IKN55_01365 [Oscillospiraceae bacterium]|nr:hypothetical protein [Oscillospiraceae bacterium]